MIYSASLRKRCVNPVASPAPADATASATRSPSTTGIASILDKVICSIAVLLFAFATYRYFFGAAFGLQLNSDAAVPVLLADEMLRKGSLLPSSWYYANGDIWILSPQIVALPFVALLGVSPLALKLANILALALMVGSLMLLIQRVTRSWLFAITIALGVVAIFSRHHANVVYEQAAYGWICAKLALLIFLSLCVLGDENEYSKPWHRLGSWQVVLYLLLLVEFAAGNPSRALAYWSAPITVACVLLPFSSRVRGVYLIVLTGSALIVGSLAHFILGRYLLVVPGVGTLQPIASWSTHAGMMWEGLPLFLQYDMPWTFSIASPTSAATFVRCFFSPQLPRSCCWPGAESRTDILSPDFWPSSLASCSS